MPVPALNIPVTIKDFDEFKRFFYRESDEKVFRSDGTSYMAHLIHDVEYLRNAHWRIICNSATPGFVGIEAIGHRVLLQCPEELLLRDNPDNPPHTGS
jgi:hypothetical protein